MFHVKSTQQSLFKIKQQAVLQYATVLRCNVTCQSESLFSLLKQENNHKIKIYKTNVVQYKLI